MDGSGGDVAVSCRDLTKSYGRGATRVAALRGVDLEIRRGEMFMLVGPSGCGKTTLLSIMGGILEPDSGRCEVLGRDPKELDATARARFRGRSIGFLFQSFNLLPALTAAENVAVPLLIAGASRREALRRAREALARVELEARSDARPVELSGGQQQRVSLARALIHEPELVLCDEPTSNLDHATGLSVMETLREVARRPERALVVVTHDPRILGFADREARMDDGCVVEVVAGGAA